MVRGIRTRVKTGKSKLFSFSMHSYSKSFLFSMQIIFIQHAPSLLKTNFELVTRKSKTRR